MTPSPDMTTILEDLAAGRIDASEAARRIDAISVSHPSDEPAVVEPTTAEPSNAELSDVEPSNDELSATSGVTDPDAWATTTDRPQRATHPTDEVRTPEAEPAPTATSATRARPAGSVERLSVRAVGRRVRIVGDPTIATVSADGPHVLRRNGAVLEISSDGELGPSLDGFQLLRGVPRTLDDFRSLGLGKELLIKVNPSIVVDVEVTAGNLNTERVPELGKVRVTAGGAKLLDVEQIADALVQAGQATIRGTLREGRSKVRAESGSLVIQLGDRSDVTIRAESQLGKVSWSGAHDGAGDEVVMGSGRARLDVDVVMGYAQVSVGSAAAAGAE